MASDLDSSLRYCTDLVREHDYDRYLCAITATPRARLPLVALTAFNLEIAKTREAVTEPMIGQIRLQWWREAIEGLYAGAPRKHEVVGALAAVIEAHSPPRALFDALIDSREFDLEDKAPRDMAGLEDYARETSAGLLRLWAAVLGEPASETIERAGTVWAMVGLLRAMPFHARQHRRYLPDSVLEEAGVREREYLDMRSSDRMAAAVQRVAARAGGILREGGTVPKPVRAMNRLSGLYLKRLAKSGYRTFEAPVEVSPGRKQLRVLTGL